MSETETDAVVVTPRGSRFALVFAAFLKHAIALPDMSQADQLWLLEAVEGLGGDGLSAEQIALVDPMGPAEVGMFIEAAKLCRGKRDRAAFELIARADVFAAFVGLNAGMAAALRWQRASGSSPSPGNSADATTPIAMVGSLSGVPPGTPAPGLAGPASHWPRARH